MQVLNNFIQVWLLNFKVFKIKVRKLNDSNDIIWILESRGQRSAQAMGLVIFSEVRFQT